MQHSSAGSKNQHGMKAGLLLGRVLMAVLLGGRCFHGKTIALGAAARRGDAAVALGSVLVRSASPQLRVGARGRAGKAACSAVICQPSRL